MQPRWVFLFLTVAVLLASTDARKKSAKKAERKASVRGRASKQEPLRTSKNRNQDVQNNAAVKNAVASMRSGKSKSGGRLSQSQNMRNGASPTNLNQPSAANLNQPQGYPSGQKRPLSASSLNQPQSAGAPTYNRGPPSPSNMNQPPPSYQQAMGSPQMGASQQFGPGMQAPGGGMAYPGGGMPYPGAPGGGQMQGYPPMGAAPMGYPGMMPMMMPMMPGQQQQAAPPAKKSLIPDFLKPKLMIDVVPLAMMAAKPIKSLFSRNDHKHSPEYKKRLGNDTSPEGSNASGPLPNSGQTNGSESAGFPFLPPPLPPMEGDNGTAGQYQPHPQMPYQYNMPSPYQTYYDENGTAHYPPQQRPPFFPFGMFSPPLYAQNENGSYAQNYPYSPYGYQPYAPLANPFYRRNWNMQNETMHVAGPMLAVEPPEAMVDPPMLPGIQVEDPNLMKLNPEGQDSVPGDAVAMKPLNPIETKVDVAEESKDAAQGSDANSEEPKTGVVYSKDIILDALAKPQMAAVVA